MTVSYSLDVSKARFCGFTKLLGRWKGGIYKILWRELFLFCFAYTVLSVTYRFYLNESQKSTFEKVVIFVETFTDLIPLSFVLGFYVSLVIGRWWSQYDTIPWPDRLAFVIGAYVQGTDERSRMIRRTLGRYVILAQTLTYQSVSTAVKRRYPNVQHLVAAGIMTQSELTVYEATPFPYAKWWLPCHWFCSLAARAKAENRISDSILLNELIQEIVHFRNECATMVAYDWISVPLVYTQVVTIATYTYSAALIIGRQYLNPEKGYAKHEIDLYIPFFSLLQFFFYVGWLKVAEQILNPYGEDDDDFELNWLLDRGIHMMYLVVDHIHMKHPKITKDSLWNIMEPKLPQTKQSAKLFHQPQLGSTFYLDVGEADYLPLHALMEQDEKHIYSNISEIKSKNARRPSFINKVWNSSLDQNASKKTQTKSIPLNKRMVTENNSHYEIPEPLPNSKCNYKKVNKKSKRILSVKRRSSSNQNFNTIFDPLNLNLLNNDGPKTIPYSMSLEQIQNVSHLYNNLNFLNRFNNVEMENCLEVDFGVNKGNCKTLISEETAGNENQRRVESEILESHSMYPTGESKDEHISVKCNNFCKSRPSEKEHNRMSPSIEYNCHTQRNSNSSSEEKEMDSSDSSNADGNSEIYVIVDSEKEYRI